MQEQHQRRQLERMRAIATGLLLAMAVLFLLSHWFRAEHAWWAWVGAFAEAAMVGALADWFAVTALFRRPLGLPIPHTAIIPRNKDRIGSSVANFLEYNFMTREVLFEEMQPIDFAGAAVNWLSIPENSRAVSAQLVAGIPSAIRLVEDDDVANLIQSTAGGALTRVKLAPVLAEVATVLIADRRHQFLFDQLLTLVSNAVENNRELIRQKIHEKSPRWLPRIIDEKLFEKLLLEIRVTIAEMREPDSPWRDQFQDAAERLIDGLRNDPVYEERIRQGMSDTIHHPLFRTCSEQFWRLLRQRLMEEGQAIDSPLAARIDRGLQALAAGLRSDPAVQERLNQWLRTFVADAIASRRHLIAGLVRRVIEKWDAGTVSEKFELYVGRDLQYIRINGTLVGGLVGLGLHWFKVLL